MLGFTQPLVSKHFSALLEEASFATILAVR
jgi:hypothetical protein